MLFNSYIFLFAFLPITLAGFFLWGHFGKVRAAALWLTLASFFFYAWWNPAYLVLILLSIAVNYWLGVAIHLARHGRIGFSPKFMLGLGVALNLAVLGYYKYAHFFADSCNSVWGLQWNVPEIFLPLAISFFTFTQIAYLVDAYHGVTEAYDFLYYALFVSFFPHLIAGPIVSYRRLMPQFAQGATYRFDAANFAAGLSMFTLGLVKKVVIADNLAILPQTTFDHLLMQPPDMLMAWLGALGYTFQLYFDFSGYSDMAIGLARMFNVRFPLNFNSPYKARDIADFWQRWHMTLSQFLRDHIYIPLGGNRVGEPRRYMNLMVTMLLGGLWHGAGWNFVFWGGLHGLALIVHRAWEKAAGGLAWSRHWGMDSAGRCLTFLIVVVGWVFFRSHSFTQAASLLATMVHPISLAALKAMGWNFSWGPKPRNMLQRLRSFPSPPRLPSLPPIPMKSSGRRNATPAGKKTSRSQLHCGGFPGRGPSAPVFSWRWGCFISPMSANFFTFGFKDMGITSFRYLAICFGVTSLCLAMVAGLNFALDPYGYYHFDKSWDWVHQRKGIAHYLFGHKARAVETFKPEVVFLGNSRVLYGLDPAQPGLPEKTYNLAMEGANIYVAWRYLQHTAIWHLPKVVILGIDLEMFDPHSPLPTAFSEDRLSVTAEGRPNLFSNLADLAPTLLSPNALYYSLKGLISPSGPVFNYANGYEADAMLKLNHMDLTRAVLGSNEAWLVPYTAGFLDANGEEPQMDAFGKIVSFCAQNHIRLIVFLHPLHASMTDVLTDDWPRYQAWMKAMVTTLEAAPGGQNELWDFVGYTTMNTESFPKPTDEYSHMRYYWECSHYRKIVGDLVLARILSGTSSTQFGQRVDSRNLSDDLNRIAVEKANWHQHGEAILIPDP